MTSQPRHKVELPKGFKDSCKGCEDGVVVKQYKSKDIKRYVCGIEEEGHSLGVENCEGCIKLFGKDGLKP